MDAEQVRERVIELETEHRDLDAAIALLAAAPTADALQLQRLKKRKLQLKDHIIRLDRKSVV